MMEPTTQKRLHMAAAGRKAPRRRPSAAKETVSAPPAPRQGSPKETASTTLRVHLWLETGKGMTLGLGRAMLLEKLHQMGSLNKAAKAMGMSYRAAWGRLKASEEQIGQPLVEKAPGKTGFVLTDHGRLVMLAFRRFQQEVEAYALTRAQTLFPWPVTAFEDADPTAAHAVENPVDEMPASAVKKGRKA